MRLRLPEIITVFVLATAGAGSRLAAQNAAGLCPQAKPVPAELKLPAEIAPGEDFVLEQRLLTYLQTAQYRKLGWCVDTGVRDTGPFIADEYYGTHKAVRIYYSPEVSTWLKNGRKGPIADGAIIIKEQYKFPAQPWIERYDGKPPGAPEDWVIMIKNRAASTDGWYWGEFWKQMSQTNRFQYPNAGYGLYCVRCHASAESESTFSALGNIEGYADPKKGPWPITYRVDDSWRTANWHETYCSGTDCKPAASLLSAEAPVHFEEHRHNTALTRLHLAGANSTGAPDPAGLLQFFPPEPLDKFLPKFGAVPGHPSDLTTTPYVTSDQCLGCHSAIPGTPFGPTMVAKDAKTTINVSEYGEWRWSPMGLAGRDPIFFAQLESEFSLEPTRKDPITNTCMNCHGAMGLKSYYLANGIDPNKLFQKPGNIQFNADWVFTTNPKDPSFPYGGLARDGISCMVCHRMKQPTDTSLAFFLKNNINGIFETEDTGVVVGPFKDITTYPMKASVGIEPKQSDFIKSSRMCGTCHTINLPIMDKPGCAFPPVEDKCTSVEQATYLEWLNSDYQNEYGTGPKAKSCQDCHMSTSYVNAINGLNVAQIKTRMAIVQDTSYPFSEHLASPKDLTVRMREEGYHRHEFLGLNGILLSFFGAFVDSDNNNVILGVRLGDYMSNLGTDLRAAIDNVVQQASHNTAKVTIPSVTVRSGHLNAKVTVENLTGHRMPSGVGFRRAFLEFTIFQDGKPVFTSGGTNASGEIVDQNGNPLPSEYPSRSGVFQPHYYGQKIDSASKVQIYEELIKDANHKFTTSFIHRDDIVKDNRLLPSGYRVNGPPNAPPIPAHFLEATHPEQVNKDPAYDGLTGGSTATTVEYEVEIRGGVEPSRFSVTATLQYQTTPPSYFADRATTESLATKRLMYLREHLSLSGTAFEGWKVAVGSASKVAN